MGIRVTHMSATHCTITNLDSTEELRFEHEGDLIKYDSVMGGKVVFTGYVRRSHDLHKMAESVFAGGFYPQHDDLPGGPA